MRTRLIRQSGVMIAKDDRGQLWSSWITGCYQCTLTCCDRCDSACTDCTQCDTTCECQAHTRIAW